MEIRHQLGSFLENEGYSLQEDGTLSEEDFDDLSSRLENDPTFTLPDEIVQSEFYSCLYEGNYEAYLDDFREKYFSALPATRGESGLFAPVTIGGKPPDLGDPNAAFRDLLIVSKDDLSSAIREFRKIAQDPVFAARVILAGTANPSHRLFCGQLLQSLRQDDPEWFSYLCEEADALSPNAGLNFIALANQAENERATADLHTGIRQTHTLFGNALAKDLAGNDRFFSVEETLSYITNRNTVTAFFTGATAQDRIREVAQVLAVELSRTGPKYRDAQFLRAAVFFDDLNLRHNAYAAELFADLYRTHPETGLHVMRTWCEVTKNQRLLEAAVPTIKGSLGNDAYYTLYDSLPRTAQGLLEPEHNVSTGLPRDMQERQEAMNRAGLAPITGADFGFSDLDIARRREELEAFLHVIPQGVRNRLAADEARLKEIYDQWARMELPKTEEEARRQGEEVGTILTKFQIESVLAQRVPGEEAVQYLIENGNLEDRAKNEMQGLFGEMEATYAVLIKAREAYQSGDIKKARGVSSYATANLFLIQQSMEVVEALSLARDSGMDGMGYQNGNEAERDTLARLETAEQNLIFARRLLGHGQTVSGDEAIREKIEAALKDAQKAYEHSIGRIKPDGTGMIRDAGWHLMTQDQKEKEMLILGAKFAVGSAAMVSLFCLAGPVGAYAGATVGGAAFGVGTTAATVTAVVVGLGVESLIFLSGEKVIAAGGAIASNLLEGNDWDKATDAAYEELVFESLEEFGWEYASTVVSLGILKNFTHGYQVLVRKKLISDGTLSYGIGFMAEMTGMGMGGIGVETLQFTFGHEPVYILENGVPVEVTDLSQIWDGDHIKDNIGGSFQTVLTYRIAGRLIKSGTEPVSRAIRDRQVKAQIEMFEAQETAFRERLKKASTIEEFEKLTVQRIRAGHALYSQSLQSLRLKEREAKTEEEKAAIAKDIEALEKKLVEYEALGLALRERAAIAADMERRVAEYNAKRFQETRDPAKPTHLGVVPRAPTPPSPIPPMPIPLQPANNPDHYGDGTAGENALLPTGTDGRSIPVQTVGTENSADGTSTRAIPFTPRMAAGDPPDKPGDVEVPAPPVPVAAPEARVRPGEAKPAATGSPDVTPETRPELFVAPGVYSYFDPQVRAKELTGIEYLLAPDLDESGDERDFGDIAEGDVYGGVLLKIAQATAKAGAMHPDRAVYMEVPILVDDEHPVTAEDPRIEQLCRDLETLRLTHPPIAGYRIRIIPTRDIDLGENDKPSPLSEYIDENLIPKTILDAPILIDSDLRPVDSTLTLATGERVSDYRDLRARENPLFTTNSWVIGVLPGGESLVGQVRKSVITAEEQLVLVENPQTHRMVWIKAGALEWQEVDSTTWRERFERCVTQVEGLYSGPDAVIAGPRPLPPPPPGIQYHAYEALGGRYRNVFVPDVLADFRYRILELQREFGDQPLTGEQAVRFIERVRGLAEDFELFLQAVRMAKDDAYRLADMGGEDEHDLLLAIYALKDSCRYGTLIDAEGAVNDTQALFDEAQALVVRLNKKYGGKTFDPTDPDYKLARAKLAEAYDLFTEVGDTDNAARAKKLWDENFGIKGGAPDEPPEPAAAEKPIDRVPGTSPFIAHLRESRIPEDKWKGLPEAIFGGIDFLIKRPEEVDVAVFGYGRTSRLIGALLAMGFKVTAIEKLGDSRILSRDELHDLFPQYSSRLTVLDAADWQNQMAQGIPSSFSVVFSISPNTDTLIASSELIRPGTRIVYQTYPYMPFPAELRDRLDNFDPAKFQLQGSWELSSPLFETTFGNPTRPSHVFVVEGKKPKPDSEHHLDEKHPDPYAPRPIVEHIDKGKSDAPRTLPSDLVRPKSPPPEKQADPVWEGEIFFPTAWSLMPIN